MHEYNLIIPSSHKIFTQSNYLLVPFLKIYVLNLVLLRSILFQYSRCWQYRVGRTSNFSYIYFFIFFFNLILAFTFESLFLTTLDLCALNRRNCAKLSTCFLSFYLSSFFLPNTQYNFLTLTRSASSSPHLYLLVIARIPSAFVSSLFMYCFPSLLQIMLPASITAGRWEGCKFSLCSWKSIC